MQSINARAAILSVVIFFVLMGVWEFSNQAPEAKKALTEYEMLMGGSEPQARVPNPSDIAVLAYDELSQPFYDKGPNDKGIGLQMLYSLHVAQHPSTTISTVRMSLPD